jgi:hypothetical protein
MAEKEKACCGNCKSHIMYKDYNYGNCKELDENELMFCTICNNEIEKSMEGFYIDNDVVCDCCYAESCALKNNDEVNHPKHYNQGKIETIDYIEGMGYIEGNIIKYVSRYKHKNGLEDLKKAKWYLDRLIKNESEGKNE